MSTLASSFSILTQPGVFLYLLRGVAFTCILSVLGVILGPPGCVRIEKLEARVLISCRLL